MNLLKIFPALLLSILVTATHAQVNITVNTGADVRPISPYVYGLNPYHYDANTTGLALHEPGLGITALRLGGDAVSTYNWENNTNISWNGACGGTYSTNDNNHFLAYATGQPSAAYGNKAGAPLKMISDAASIGGYPLLQLTAMQYVSKDAAGCLGAVCSQGVSSGRMARAITTKPGTLSLNPNTADTVVYADEELFYIRAQSNAPSGPRGYCLENEAGIWHETHPCAHPTRATCAEVLEKNISLATRIRALDPGADIFGPGMFGFTEYMRLNYTPQQPNPSDWSSYNLSDTVYNPTTYNYMTWVCSYLRNMRNAHTQHGTRLLDVLDLHYYNSGDNLVQDSRSFWDSSYVEQSYITQDIISGTPLRLVHCLNRAINDWYPGTRLGITEWGLLDNNDPAAGIYTADMLGAMGRYGVYQANYFGILQGYTAGAFKIFRNYDQQGGAYPATSVHAASSDNSTISAYAAIDAGNDSVLHLILINRAAGSQTANVALQSSAPYNQMQRCHMSGNGSGAISALTSPEAISGNQVSISLQGRSVYHLVLRRGGGMGLQDHGGVPLRIYPNPVQDWLYLADLKSVASGEILVLDMPGKIVARQSIAKGQAMQAVNVSQLAPGSYVVVAGGKRALFQKLAAE